MEYLTINGGKRLNGRLRVHAAKNSVLPIIACSLMVSDVIVLKGVPPLNDILAMMRIISSIGGVARLDGDCLTLDCTNCNPERIAPELTSCIRSSIFILGPILARYKKAVIAYPGGCDIGLRPIDLHIDGLKALNVQICEDGGYINCDASNIKSGEVTLDFPSVGATENIMMAAVLTKGRTVIRNCAREPEIVDLGKFIVSLGGKVYGYGSDTIIIEGVNGLHGTTYAPMVDRIVGGTYLAACAMTGGQITLEDFNVKLINSVAEKMVKAGAQIIQNGNDLTIISQGKLRSVHKIETQPYPGFPTDMQAQTVAMLSVAQGYSVMVENLFESRYKYTQQLAKMGAKITVKDRIAVIKGVKKLTGATLYAQDLRGGAALVLAALRADGTSEIYGLQHIDRGYYRIENDLSLLGADIVRRTR